jgi:hypothetical protein
MNYLDKNDFLGIFVSAAFVILFGAIYVGFFTLVKMEKLRTAYLTLAYLAWGIQAYSMMTLGMLVKSEPFTQGVLLSAMVGYLLIPHFIYFLVKGTHERYEHHTGGVHD